MNQQRMKAYICLLILPALPLSCAGDAFQNLGFDNANTNNIAPLVPGVTYDFFGPAGELVPGWHLAYGTDSVTRVGFNLTPIGPDVLSIYNSNAVDKVPLEGLYSLAFYPCQPTS